MRGGAQPGAVNLVIGQRYRLHSANYYGPGRPVTLIMTLRSTENTPEIGFIYSFEMPGGGIDITRASIVDGTWVITPAANEPEGHMGGRRKSRKTRRRRLNRKTGKSHFSVSRV